MTDNEERTPAIDVQNPGSELQVHTWAGTWPTAVILLTNAT